MTLLTVTHAGGETQFYLSAFRLTTRCGEPAMLEAQFPVGERSDLFGSDPLVREGCKVTLQTDGEAVFTGYIFTITFTGEQVVLTCHDLLRYLQYRDVRLFRRRSLSEIVTEVAREQQLPLGAVIDTRYPLPPLLCDGETVLGLLSRAAEMTYDATGRRYLLTAADGMLTLAADSRAESKAAIGESDILSFALTRDLSATANKIVLLRRDDRRGYESVTVREDTAAQSRWGTLTHFERVNSSLGDGETAALAEAMLNSRGTPEVTLVCKARANLSCLAGNCVRLTLKRANIDGTFLIEASTIVADKDEETMTLRLRPQKS